MADAPLTWDELRPLMVAVMETDNMGGHLRGTSNWAAAIAKAVVAAQPQPQPAQPLTGAQEEALRLLFKDAMDWGRSYGQSLSMSDITIQDVSQGFADLAKRALTAPSTPTPEVAP